MQEYSLLLYPPPAYIRAFLPDRSNIISRNRRHKRVLNTLVITSQAFCVVFFFFFLETPRLTDSYDFQMGEQERAGEGRINWIQKISITLMNAPC